MKNLSRPEYSTGKFRLIGAILKMHRFETYRRTERISYPPFTSHFSFQSITGIDLYSRFGGEDLHLTPACWIIHPSSRPCIISFRIQFPSMPRKVATSMQTAGFNCAELGEQPVQNSVPLESIQENLLLPRQ